MHRSRRLHGLAGYDANVAVACRSRTYHCRHYRDPMAYRAEKSPFSPPDGLHKHEDAEGAEYLDLSIAELPGGGEGARV